MFDEADFTVLEGPHVARAWFADVDLASGRRRLFTGLGSVTVGGHTWEGVNDPFGGQLVALGSVQEPRFGTAPAVPVALSGANRTFLRDLWNAKNEGRRCDLYWAAFDGETGDVLIPLRLLFRGRLSAPTLEALPRGGRAIAFNIVSINEGLNFPAPNLAWSPAGQRSRYPGDKGLDHIGSDLVEVYKQ